MAPRPAGEADKFGNRFEGAWTIRHALYVLLGTGASLTVEPCGTLGEGAEFVYRRHDGVTEAHQVKRQNRNANSWNVASLRDKGVWTHLRGHVEAGREFHFVSLVPAREIDELADRARRADHLATFEGEWLTEGLRGPFDALTAREVYGSPETAWRMLRGLRVAWPDERDLANLNAALAEQALAGAPGRLSSLALGDLLLDNLGTTLDAPTIASRLAAHGVRRADRPYGEATADQVRSATTAWASSVGRALLRPSVPREETDRLVEHLTVGRERLTLLTGTAGSGKSSVLHQVHTVLAEQAVPTLAFRLDRMEPFSSTHELGRRIGLTVSPVSALGVAAEGRTCVLIIDQLDAVSLASGRIPDTFDAVADLVGEAAAHPAMRVVLVCRAFDVEADPRIRRLTEAEPCTHIAVESLSDEQIDTAVTAMGLDAAELSQAQRTLLRSPMNLVLLAQTADQGGALSFQTTRQLFDAFWDSKRQACARRRPSVRFHEAVSAVAAAMSARQRLSVPYNLLDADELASGTDVLVSEQVLVRDGRQLAFFHESFFDYAFARGSLLRNETLESFLLGGNQELFRRGQVRQVLDHLRDLDPERFVEEVEGLLTGPGIRYHLKDVTLALLRGLDAPTEAEWDAVARVLETRPSFRERLAHAVGNAAWFGRADDAGAVEEWLTGEAEERDWALRMLTGAVAAVPDRVAGLLEPRTSEPEYGSWLLRVTCFASVGECRRLFELLIDGVRGGLLTDREHELWFSVRDLAAEQPAWAVELLVVLLADRPGALRIGDDGKATALLSRDDGAVRLVTAAAEGAPEDFCGRLLPVLLKVMEATAHPAQAGLAVFDRHFAFQYDDGRPGTLGEALFQGMVTAVQTVAGRDPVCALTLSDGLAASPYDAAQWLLYQALAAAGQPLSARAAEILLQGRHRFLSGHGANAAWGARQVLRAIGSSLPDDMLRRLEERILHLRVPPDEKFSPWHEFTLLSALPEDRLSDRAARRLGELRRRHQDRQQPDEPLGVRGGIVGPPIPLGSAQHMSDDQWLSAMRKHGEDRTDWRAFTGGAWQQSQVLQTMTQADPLRFARLALRIDAGTHPAYGSALLRGLGDAEPIESEAVFAAIRRLAGHGDPALDRWLGWGLRRYLDRVPPDLVQLLVTIVLAADQGEDDGDEVGDTDRDLLTAGINTVRGSAAECLADLLLHDTDGSRIASVLPHLSRMAADPSLPVRACAARVLHVALRRDRAAATDAFGILISAPDQLLASPYVASLVVAVCHGAPAEGRPVIERMLNSPVVAVRRVGGQIAALAAMQWELPDLLAAVLVGGDGAQRQGAAEVCAQRLSDTGDAGLAHRALAGFFHDAAADVREAAAAVAAMLRGKRLGPFRRTLTGLIGSPAFQPALAQLLLTLEQAPDRVDDLILAAARQFIAVSDPDSTDLATDAAADAHHIGRLLTRAYAQAGTAPRRAEVLDLLDHLLLLGAYGVAEAIGTVDRA
ncbi:hypothetical protein AB0O91_20390 [Kitasatospora sp. NPDC089797]|uniref:hypothetical protein n=1 Tax=Kitasatospora sp. NPDC089797 TaxID=3155298 RepID=UPI003436700E